MATLKPENGYMAMTWLLWWFCAGIMGTVLLSIFFRGLHVQGYFTEYDR